MNPNWNIYYNTPYYTFGGKTRSLTEIYGITPEIETHAGWLHTYFPNVAQFCRANPLGHIALLRWAHNDYHNCKLAGHRLDLHLFWLRNHHPEKGPTEAALSQILESVKRTHAFNTARAAPRPPPAAPTRTAAQEAFSRSIRARLQQRAMAKVARARWLAARRRLNLPTSASSGTS